MSGVRVCVSNGFFVFFRLIFISVFVAAALDLLSLKPETEIEKFLAEPPFLKYRIFPLQRIFSLSREYPRIPV